MAKKKTGFKARSRVYADPSPRTFERNHYYLEPDYRALQLEYSYSVLSPQDLANNLSSQLKVLEQLQLIFPLPMEAMQDAGASMHETKGLLKFLHAEGHDIEGPVRHALSWMDPAELASLLSKLTNNQIR